MSLGYYFVLDQVQRLSGGGAVLDYGCGTGEFVALARRFGLRACGCDRYDGPWAWMLDEANRNPELANSLLRIAPDGSLPFASGFFDVVTSNMVFEHIPDLRPPLAEIARVLKPGGALVALFPSREVWHETHVGVPFVHRFRPGSALQRSYLSLAHRLGFGARRQPMSRQDWVARSVVQLRDECFHKPVREFEALFAQHFASVERGEAAWLRHRIDNHWLLRRAAFLVSWRGFDGLLGYLASRLATQVFILRRKQV